MKTLPGTLSAKGASMTCQTEWDGDSLDLIRARYAAPLTRRLPTPGETADMNGRLAAAMVPRAMQLAATVRDEDRASVAVHLEGLTPPELRALCVVLAAMVDIDATAGDLLAWVTWDEHGRPLRPGTELVMASPRLPRDTVLAEMPPCGSQGAVSRHYRLGEPLDPACREQDRQRQRDARTARKETRDAA